MHMSLTVHRFLCLFPEPSFRLCCPDAISQHYDTSTKNLFDVMCPAAPLAAICTHDTSKTFSRSANVCHQRLDVIEVWALGFMLCLPLRLCIVRLVQKL